MLSVHLKISEQGKMRLSKNEPCSEIFLYKKIKKSVGMTYSVVVKYYDEVIKNQEVQL